MSAVYSLHSTLTIPNPVFIFMERESGGEKERLRRIDWELSLVNLAWLTESDKEAGEVKTNK